MVKHYKELAYIGVHSRIAASAHHLCLQYRRCKEDILRKRGCADFGGLSGFNLDIVKFVHANTKILSFYYISPKIWAWKEYRIKNIKRDVDELFSILPFEVEFFEGKHRYPIHYVGNPTVDEVTAFLASSSEHSTTLSGKRTFKVNPSLLCWPVAASRKSWTICPICFVRFASFPDYQLVLAGAPGHFSRSITQTLCVVGGT